jgi:hypothetical protein
MIGVLNAYPRTLSHVRWGDADSELETSGGEQCMKEAAHIDIAMKINNPQVGIFLFPVDLAYVTFCIGRMERLHA